MTLRTVLYRFIREVNEEAKRNPDFAKRLKEVLEPAAAKRQRSKATGKRHSAGLPARPANRRPPAVLDPIFLAQQGEEALRAELLPLSLDQLKDIVADYGMDQKKLVMKWRTPERIVDRIVEVSIARAHKGEAFRS